MNLLALSLVIAVPPAPTVVAEAESHMADFRGVQVHYRLRPADEPADPSRTLVFVHGWSCDHTVWRQQMEAFESHRLIAVDLPGHGRSDKPRRDYTMDFFADAMAAVLDDARVDSAVLVGHSNGAPVIRQFWRRYPARTEGLVVVDGALKAVIGPAQVEMLKEQLRGPAGEAMVRQMFTGMAPRVMNDQEREDYLAMALSTPEHVRISSFVEAADPDLWTDEPITVPTLAIMADAPFWDDAYVAYVTALVPDLEYHTIPDVSHFVMIDAPSRFNELVEAFLLDSWSIDDVPEHQPGEDAMPESRRTRQVAIVLYQGVELLDFAGPGEVFQVAGSLFSEPGGRAFDVFTVGATEDSILSQEFVTISPAYSIANAPVPDVVVLPGGPASELTEHESFMTWLRDSASKAEIAMSVCTGAFVYGHAGMLDDIEATTWHGAIDRFANAFPDTIVRQDVRFVDSGHIVTTAGVSAGIDGALHVVGRLLGRDAAMETARYMEYRWQPTAAELASYG